MRLLPVLLSPRFQAFRHRWRPSPKLGKRILQDMVVTGVMFGIMTAMYSGTHRMLEKVGELSHLAYMPVSHTLGLIFLLLLGMLFISALVIAFSVFLRGRDLDLLLAAPIQRHRFFYGKFMQVCVASCWMPFIFVIPVLAAFGHAFNVIDSAFIGALIILPPYFIIPTAAAVAIVMLLTVAAPMHRSRELLFVSAIAAIFALVALLKVVTISSDTLSSTKNLLRIVSMFSMPNVHWLPSTWVGRCFQQIFEMNAPSAMEELLLLYSVAGVTLCIAYLTVTLGHSHAYTKVCSLGLRSTATANPANTPLFLQRLTTPQLSIIFKEVRTISRDTSQAMQILILFTLGGLYLYNLQIFGAANLLPNDFKTSMRIFFFIANSAMGAFITTALCTRFVFPCIPLEGPAFWVIEKSPFSLRQLLQAKFICWLIPVMLASWLVFSAGAFAIEPSARVILINLLTATCISFGIVGMGIGFGAFFGDFDWEHASQLHAGFGSLIYMLFAVLLISMSMVPTGILLYVTDPITGAKLLSPLQQAVWAIISIIWLMGINYLACALSLRLGEHALQERT